MAEIRQAEQQQEQEQYVKRLCVAKCEYGSMDYQYLNLPKDHGVYYQDYDHPLMNANDHVGKEHVMHFGRCQSPKNPKNMASDILGKVVPIIGVIDFVKSDLLQCDGCKCEPKTLRSWEEVNKANRLDGAPAVVNSSQLVCTCGGVITITEENTGDSNQTQDQTQEQTEAEKDVLDTLPSNMADKIRSMNADADAKAQAAIEATMAWYGENVATYPQSFGCTLQMSQENYDSNSVQMISPECMNEAGYVCDYAGLSNYNMAGANAGVVGAGAAAAYNVLHAVGCQMGMADIIYGMEQQQTVRGYMDGGPMAASICGLRGFFGSMGLATEVAFPTELTESSLQLQKGEVAVLGMSQCMEIEKPVLSPIGGVRAVESHAIQARAVGKCDNRPSFTSKGLANMYAAKTQDQMAAVQPAAMALTKTTAKVAEGTVTKTLTKRVTKQKDSLCTISRGEHGLICMERPEVKVGELLQGKTATTMMLMTVKNDG